MISDQERMRQHFRAAARQIMERQPGIPFPELVVRTMATQPPDFGVSYDTAVCKVRALLRYHRMAAEGRTGDGKGVATVGQRGGMDMAAASIGGSSPKRRYWAELCRRVQRRMAPPHSQTLPRAVQYVLTSERPDCWHLSYLTACKWLEGTG